MNQPHYDVRTTSDRLQFEFVSKGPKGLIVKRIEYTYIEGLDFWNLGFGDFDPDTGQINDQTISDNGDGRKVLATVAFSIREFMTVHSNATVFFSGSTDQRTQIYKWVIYKYWSDISADFYVDGITETSDVIPFTIQQDYLGFLIRKK
ncbi:DUF6934 family protein [Spirosoma agri]|uniref:Uncharacterized protein n=1 Tax=Spirosoma agri TaxID=1987381 RepID=A0A6M0IIP1_9BACT|nr:hypothetical protein [Spirosoma agri]NEU67231.1 hypothetical protein [Spirosoma agri]